MTFLHPALLAAGAACIAIPIIIHLLMHRRRKPVMWGAMRFLVEAYKRQRRKLMVEKWVLLAARCLLLLLLALAVGRPLMEKLGGGSAGGRTIYLLIDNGIGSSAREGGVGGTSALERHKASARAILNAVRAAGGGGAESDRVGLIALGGPAEGVVTPPSANIGSIESLIDGLESTDSRADIPGALALVAGAVGRDGDGERGAGGAPERTFVVLLSDFTEGAADLAPGGADGTGAARLPVGVRVLASEPAMAALSNVAITGVEPLRSVLIDAARAGAGGAAAGGNETNDLVRVMLMRTGEGVSQSAVTTLRARLAPAESGAGEAGAGGGSSAEQTVVRWSPGQETAVAVAPVRADRKLLSAMRGGAGGAIAGEASPEVVLIASIDDDAIAGDNRWRRPIEVRESLKVGVVAPIRFGKAERVDKLDPGSWARLALQPAGEGTGIDVTDIEPASLDQSRLAGLDAVIIARPDLLSEASWARVRVFVEGGGMAVVTPPPEASGEARVDGAGGGGGSTTTHVWGDAMSRGLGAEWMPAREAKSVEGSRLVRGEKVGGGNDTANVLALVEGELDELLGAVHVSRVLPLNPAPEGGETLLRMEDGTAVLWVGEITKSQAASKDTRAGGGRGMVVYLGVGLDLEWSDLPAKPLMVPLMQELVRQGVGRARGSWQSIAGNAPTVPARTAELRRLADPARPGTGGGNTGRAEASEASATRIRVNETGVSEPVRRAGVYRAMDERGANRGIVAVNADARGGRTGVQTRDAVGAWLKKSVGGAGDEGVAGAANVAAGGGDAVTWIPGGSAGGAVAGGGSAERDIAAAVAGVLGRGEQGSPISLPLLIGALAVALIEVLLARRASHAEIRTDGAGVPSGSRERDGADARSADEQRTGVAA